jgi:hypothetical protein
MSLECYRNRLRAIEIAAREWTASAECAGTTEPVVIQIAVRFPGASSRTDVEVALDEVIVRA